MRRLSNPSPKRSIALGMIWPTLALAIQCAATLFPATTYPSEGPSPSQQTAPAANSLLLQHGLTLHRQTWLLPEEVKLRQYLADWKRLVRGYHLAHRNLAAQLKEIDAQRADYQRAQQLHEELTKARRQPGLPLERLQQMVDESNRCVETINRLRPMFADPHGVSDSARVQSAVNALAEAQTALTVAWLYVSRYAPGLAEHYQALADNSAIQAALGTSERLGPARDYANDLQRLERERALALPDAVPLGRRESQYLIRAIVGEEVVVPFKFLPDQQVSLITERQLTAAGIDVPTDAPRGTLNVNNMRQMEVRRIVVPELWIGGHHLQQLPLHVLPPEADDLGAMLGGEALGNWRATIRLETLEFTLESTSATPLR